MSEENYYEIDILLTTFVTTCADRFVNTDPLKVLTNNFPIIFGSFTGKGGPYLQMY